MPRGKTFIYSNSNIRVGEEPASHREGTRSLQWFEHSEEAWGNINWDIVKARIANECHGTREGARVIETTLNVLDKYTGKNRKTTVSAKDQQDFGITQALIDQLQYVSTDAVSASLLKYMLKPGVDKNVPGFSFEERMSDFIQRLLGDSSQGEDFDTKKFVAGKDRVYAGESVLFYFGDHVKDVDFSNLKEKDRADITKTILDQTKIDYKNLVSYVYKNIEREIDGITRQDIAVVAYKVPQKADIIANTSMEITATYGKLVQDFLTVIKGAKLSLKNHIDPTIKLGSTNDLTRLRGFITEFLEGVKKNFSTVCTFIFASKKSRSKKVQRYLDWARILYELLGTGQMADFTGKKQGENLLVDYLVINRYKPDGSSGKVTVFNVKDLISKSIPQIDYKPPFNFEGSNREGPVVLNFGQAKNFVFSS